VSWDISKTYKWDKRYINLAAHIAKWSKDPSRKIGAVAVGSKGQVLSQGYNGFPRGISDDDNMYQNKVTKYQRVVHAEMNCIYNATYNGTSLDGATLYIHGLPVCSECAKGIIQVGIKRVVTKEIDDSMPERWVESTQLTKQMFEESGVTYDFI
jgi:dCMP deaminase|tara:strand:- start:598 stop:1059 length:462 start_codon:yes stop_codon:yes gene_type:complete